ncbi:hypothetical protein JTB14_001480 [Gonioctena quinquepunctata]|nr:hypothetical protein JTB14_001480 [Gonioctena quinquepunctata]
MYRVFLGLDPQVVVVDPEYAKNIMTKDFAYFIDRGVYKTPSDAVTVNLFAQEGAEWKVARAKFTSLFTSGKMRKFLERMKHCSEVLVASLQKHSIENADVHILEVMGCYTTDVIGSVLLGIQCNSFKDTDAEFRNMGRKLFGEFSWIDQCRLFSTIFFPKLAEKLGVSNIQPQVSEFYIKTVTEIVNYREENKIRTTDFLQMLIDLKNSEEISLTMKELIGQVNNH